MLVPSFSELTHKLANAVIILASIAFLVWEAWDDAHRRRRWR
jgi:hypothetical protein